MEGKWTFYPGAFNDGAGGVMRWIEVTTREWVLSDCILPAVANIRLRGTGYYLITVPPYNKNGIEAKQLAEAKAIAELQYAAQQDE